MQIAVHECGGGAVLPLLPAGACAAMGHVLNAAPLPWLPVGTRLRDQSGAAVFMVADHVWIDAAAPERAAHAVLCPMLRALLPACGGAASLDSDDAGWSLAVVTLSDKGACQERADKSGPAIAGIIEQNLPLAFCRLFLMGDDEHLLRALLTHLALENGYSLIVTTGGTGVGPRDFTPQATARVLDFELPGFAGAMLAASLAKTPNAAISRSVAGVLGKSLLVNVPGSVKGAGENIAAILPALPHALKKIHGDSEDCGG